MTWDELKAMHAGVSHDAVDPDEYAAAMHNAFPAIVVWVEAMRAALAKVEGCECGCPRCWKTTQASLALADKPLTEDAK